VNDELVNELLTELKETRKSFEGVIKSVKWNRRNTAIQYFLLVLVFFLGAIGTMNYFNYRQDACERSNNLRVTLQESMSQNAFAIGVALQSVFNAPEERLNQYLEAYNAQRPTEPFGERKC